MIVPTIIAIIAVACMCKILHFSIQPRQWLGFWDEVLARWDRSGHQGLAKMFGYCEMCFSHMCAFVGFIVYMGVMLYAELWTLDLVMSIVMYFIFIPISTIVNLRVLSWK